MDKKAFIHHPIVLALIAFLVGMLIMFLLVKNIIPNPIAWCGS